MGETSGDRFAIEERIGNAMLIKNELVTAFRNAGLTAGDLVLVHSSLRKLGPVEGGADTVLDALLEVLGQEGTLALPTHTFSVVTARQPVFHQSLTPASSSQAWKRVQHCKPSPMIKTLPFQSRKRTYGLFAEQGVVSFSCPSTSFSARGPMAATLCVG